MADFTMEVRDLKDAFYDALTDYPIFDEAHRSELNDKLYRHYKYREIGFETIDMFVDRLRTRMWEIMPPINEIWKTTGYEYNPLDAVDMYSESESSSRSQGTAESESAATDKSTGDSKSDSTGRTQTYEMPQTANVAGENYATSAGDSASTGLTETSSRSDSSSTSRSDTDNRGTSATTSHQHGRTMPAQELIRAQRDLIVNLDMLVVEGVSDLFMSLWSANYPYSHGRSLYGYAW